MRPIRVLLIVLVFAAAMATAPPAYADDAWAWPVGRAGLGHTFDPPVSEYGPGHRGIDIAARSGTPVRAVAPGIVTFAGRVGAVDVVTVDHGGERSTHQPVSTGVRQGDAVRRGEVVGTLLPGPSHCAGPCLHLGRMAADADDHDGEYLDPLELLGGGQFRLISPEGKPPGPPVGSGGSLRKPVAGSVSSPYGMRVHPITGVRKLHDGIDFAAGCSTAVHAAAAGVVTSMPTDGAYGRRIVIKHPGGLKTGYAHLSSRAVATGRRVSAGQVIGRVGSTGLSTGCHLHFMVLRGGQTTNPQAML